MLMPQVPFSPSPSPRSLGASKDIRGASWPTDESKGERHGDRMEEQRWEMGNDGGQRERKQRGRRSCYLPFR